MALLEFNEKPNIIKNVVYSHIKKFEKYKGVVPEIASRAHLEVIDIVYKMAAVDEFDYIAVTEKPGLIGSLLIGLSFARGLSIALNKELIYVDHLHGHVFSPLLTKWVEPPFIGVVLSGGHTDIYLVKDFKNLLRIGRTLDDAIGEAFDKVGVLLGGGYPGGPYVEKLALKGKVINVLSRPFLKGSLNFSFSGIKTAVLYALKKYKKEDLACDFQAAVSEVVEYKIKLAMENYNIRKVLIGGGVISNKYLRRKLKKIGCILVNKRYATDNAAMIALAGYLKKFTN